MKDYIPGAIISLILLIIFLVFDSQLYKNVMPTSVMISLLVTQVFFYKFCVTEKKVYPYVILIQLLILSVYFSLPEYTYDQAKAKVEKDYSLVDVSVEKVPFDTSDSWNPFESNWGYLFSGNEMNSDKTVSILVVPDNGRMIEVDE